MKQYLTIFILALVFMACSRYAGAVIRFAEDKPAATDTLSPDASGELRIPLYRVDGEFNRPKTIELSGTEILFKKEPSYKGIDIIRGVIPAGQGKEGRLCFAWDVQFATLYLDLNRNLDLTDDPEGIFSSKGGRNQYFRDISLPVRFGQETTAYTVNFDFTKTSSWTSCIMRIRTCWRGDFRNGDDEWEFLLSDNLDTIIDNYERISLIPHKSGLSTNNTFAFYDLKLPRRMCINTDCYDISFEPSQNIGTQSPVLVLTPSKVPRGEIVINGHADYLLLEAHDKNESTIVIFDPPPSSAMIPCGRYTSYRWGFGKSMFTANLKNKIDVVPESPQIISVGGPLNNSVTAKRRFDSLDISYCLKDISGQILDQRTITNKPPTFVVLKGDKKIGSGTFEYG